MSSYQTGQAEQILAGALLGANQKKREAIDREVGKFEELRQLKAELETELRDIERTPSTDALTQKNNNKVIAALAKKISGIATNESKALSKIADMNYTLTEKIKADRKYIPVPQLKWSERDQATGESLRIQSFDHVDLDEATFNKVFNVLAHAESLRIILAELAGTFECDQSEVLLYRIEGAYCRVWCTYNEDFNDVLKSTESAKFSKLVKTWDVELGAEAQAILSDEVQCFFAAVINIETLSVLKNTDTPSESATQQYEDIGKLDAPTQINVESLLHAICTQRVADFNSDAAGAVLPGDIRLCIYDGVKFVPYPENSTVLALVNDLLIRYSSRYGTLRYVRYDLTGECLTDIAFSNNQKAVNAAIASYSDSCRITNNPAVTFS